jgi:hypothetical protein
MSPDPREGRSDGFADVGDAVLLAHRRAGENGSDRVDDVQARDHVGVLDGHRQLFPPGDYVVLPDRDRSRRLESTVT